MDANVHIIAIVSNDAMKKLEKHYMHHTNIFVQENDMGRRQYTEQCEL